MDRIQAAKEVVVKLNKKSNCADQNEKIRIGEQRKMVL
jgi:hypothetical protein